MSNSESSDRAEDGPRCGDLTYLTGDMRVCDKPAGHGGWHGDYGVAVWRPVAATGSEV